MKRHVHPLVNRCSIGRMARAWCNIAPFEQSHLIEGLNFIISFLVILVYILIGFSFLGLSDPFN